MGGKANDLGGRVCPLCGHDEAVSRGKLAPNVWQFTCSIHPDWHLDVDGTAKALPEWSGVMGELGLYDDLPQCLVSGEPFVEYGVVEYRYRERFPHGWSKVRERYPYRDEQQYVEYTVSAFLAAALGRLDREGVLRKKFGPATGYWEYNGQVSYWALPPPGAGEDVTWEDFASQHGIPDVPPD